MTKELIKKRPNKIPAKEAAEIMGVTPQLLYCGLRQGRFPFGTAVKMKGRWAYYINAERFVRWMEGTDLAGKEGREDGNLR